MDSQLKNLLAWSTGQSSGNGDAPPNPASVASMDRELMEAVLGKDDITRMKDALAFLRSGNNDVEMTERSLDDLLFLVESIDNAKYLISLGGLPLLHSLLEHDRSTVRMGAAWILGTATHNNPDVQAQVLKLNILPKLLWILRHDADCDVRSKALSTVSALLGHNDEAQAEFVTMGGLEVFSECLSDNNAGDLVLQRKIVFMLGQFAQSNPLFTREILSHGVVSTVMRLLALDDADLNEKSLSFFLMLLGEDETPTAAVVAALSREGVPDAVASARQVKSGESAASFGELADELLRRMA